MCTFRFDDQFTFCLNFLLFTSFTWVPKQINLFIAYFFTLSSVNGLGIVFGQKTTFCRSVYVFSYLLLIAGFIHSFFLVTVFPLKKISLFYFTFSFYLLYFQQEIR